MSMLPIFHGKPSEDPYRHVDKQSQVCEISHLQNVPADMMKMKLFLSTLRDPAKDLFLKLGKELTSWMMSSITRVFRRCCVSISCNKIYISLLSIV